MLSTARSQAELQIHRQKLANSYNELLKEFSSVELHTVGNYAVGAFIGKGSFGKVYLARHNLTRGSKVVLKSTKKDDPNLAREIHHHRQFIHPHIARLYEVIATESNVWLVLEYCPGDELYHYLTKNGPLPAAKVQKIFTQLVGAVTYVHNKSCVHRDLKLENILLDKHENVKLVDFGFTREYEGKYSYLQTWCGTTCYSAPEMLKGEKYAAEKVDVWSLGIILYALLCGELPFDEDDDNATKAKILKEEPKYPETIPVQAKDLIVTLLSKRPLIRPGLADILTNPWLVEHSPAQQAILKLQKPAPFSTQLEKDTLERMRACGVDIDAVIESVLSQRCDALAGWWALLLEREERKEKRRQKRRREKEADARLSRRISAASSRVIAPRIDESDEDRLADARVTASREEVRGRALARLEESATARPTTAGTAERVLLDVPTSVPSDKPGQQIASSEPPPRVQLPSINTQIIDSRSHRNSFLQSPQRAGVSLGDPVSRQNSGVHVSRNQSHLFRRFVNLRRWFIRRGKSPASGPGGGQAQLSHHHNTLQKKSRNDLQRLSVDASFRRNQGSSHYPDLSTGASFRTRQRVNTNTSATGAPNPSTRRLSSQSPAPLTPSSSYKRRSNASAAGLRGRKSTSSSISSVRSLHVRHASHSKASSISSNSIGSPSSPNSKTLPSNRKGSNVSAKFLPTQPATASSPFHSGIRLIRGPPLLQTPESHNVFVGLGPPSPGLTFTKRRRSPFKGPSLGANRHKTDGAGGSGIHSRRSSIQSESHAPVTIAEENEDEAENGFGHGGGGDDDDDDEDIEEVDVFLPVDPRLGEYVEEEDEGPPHRLLESPLTKWEVEG